MKSKSFKKGFRKGYIRGYKTGHGKGFIAGYQSLKLDRSEPFEGTSIIIPTYNKRDYLAACIDSIKTYTPQSYEIIVVDNGSTDGTYEYLQAQGKHLKFRISEKNLGFAGAVNQGLKMAGGSTLLILNNDTIVTHQWLSNLLACVNSNADVGLAGPVTNYISGEQLIEVHYDSIPDMHEFAAKFNVSDPAKWIINEKLTGFCMCMRRDVFERLGYFDEGFEIGNCEDDDYALRAKLLGYDLIIAKDTFIHHFGSQSMKELGTNFDEVYGKNLLFYSEKWADPHALFNHMRKEYAGSKFNMANLYPSHILVKTARSSPYWIENGVRYAVNEAVDHFPITLISEVELRQWPEGNAISAAETAAKMTTLMETTNALHDGDLLQTPDGTYYQYHANLIRRLISKKTLTIWGLETRVAKMISFEQKAALREGIPIIPCPVYKAQNL